MTEQNPITITSMDWPKCARCMRDIIPGRPGCNCPSLWDCDCEWCGGKPISPEMLEDYEI